MENNEQMEKAVFKKKMIHAFISGVLVGVGFVVLIIAAAMLM